MMPAVWIISLCVVVGGVVGASCSPSVSTPITEHPMQGIPTQQHDPPLLVEPTITPSEASAPAAITPSANPPRVPTETASPTSPKGITATPSPVITPQRSALFDYTRAVRMLEVEEYKDAIASFGIVIRVLPDFALAYHGRALAYYHEELYSLALDDFDKAIELKPDMAVLYSNRAMLHMDLGKTNLAVEDLEKALILFDPVRDADTIAKIMIVLDELKP